jgi:hypothetical protein
VVKNEVTHSQKINYRKMRRLGKEKWKIQKQNMYMYRSNRWDHETRI